MWNASWHNFNVIFLNCGMNIQIHKIQAMIRYMIKIMLGSIPHQFFFIIYLIQDEQELSLGMLILLRRIYNF